MDNVNDYECDGECNAYSYQNLMTRNNFHTSSKMPKKGTDDQTGDDLGYDSYDSGIALSFKSGVSSGEFEHSLPSVPENSEISNGVDRLTEDLNKKLCVHEAPDEAYVSFECNVRPNKTVQNVNDRITNEALEVYGKDEDGDTLLHVAIIHEQINLCMFFIQIAPWFDWLDIYNNELHQTPLHLAVIMRQKSIVRRLMAGGATIEMRDHNGDTPLHIACREGHFEVAETLLTPLSSEETDCNEYQIRPHNIPQNLELRNCAGNTCLHEAVQNKRYDILKLLLEKGADVNARDGKQGATVLHYAAVMGNEKLTGFLLGQRGLLIDSVMYNGATPAMLAHSKGHSRIYGNLVKLGANADFDCSPDYSSDEEDM